jgi:hypothetical protein
VSNVQCNENATAELQKTTLKFLLTSSWEPGLLFRVNLRVTEFDRRNTMTNKRIGLQGYKRGGWA